MIGYNAREQFFSFTFQQDLPLGFSGLMATFAAL
jgi:hypothetical protein